MRNIVITEKNTYMIFPILTEESKKLPVYVTSVGGRNDQEPVNRPAGFPSWHWLQVVSGAGRLELGGREYHLRQGMGFLVAPGVPHRYEATETPWATKFVTFEGQAAATLAAHITADLYEVFRLKGPEVVEQALEQIEFACARNNILQAFEASAFLNLFLVMTARNAVPWDARASADGEGGFHEVLHHIESNYAEALSLDELAGIAQVTPQHLCRLFRQHVNARPFEYITRVRLQKAKSLMLSNPTDPLKNIADACGFGDPSYFAKQFRQYEGITPMSFRRIYSGLG